VVAPMKRKTVAKAAPDNPEAADLIRSLDAQRVKAEAKAEARKIAEARAPERPAPPPEYAQHNRTLPLLPADETQTALHYLKTQGISNPTAVVSWAVLHIPEVCRECVREFRLDGSLRAEKLGEPLLKAWCEAHHE
jgi:hypothetical protein